MISPKRKKEAGRMPDLCSRTCCFAGSAVLPYRERELRERVRAFITELVSVGVVFFGLGGEKPALIRSP